MASDKVIHLTDATFDQQIQSGLTLVDFWAEWCGPCKALAPTIEALAETYDGKIKVCKLDVDSNQQAAARFGIRGIPTVMLFKDGRQADILTGNDPQRVKAMVSKAIAG
ncbi:thioredoxin [Deltaproteobacteria bacterium TL4]